MSVTTEPSPQIPQALQDRPSPRLASVLAGGKVPGGRSAAHWSFIKRAFPAAVAIFAAVNLAFSGALVPKSLKDDEKNARGGDFWTNPALIDLAVHQFKESSKLERPKVVLLGSSLVMFPFWAMDASINPKIEDIAHYHRSMALSQTLGLPQKGIDPASSPAIFNLASAGQMSSDTYLYVTEFLNGPSKPDVIFWGVAPRDFGDANLTSPMSTVSFKRIVNLQNLDRYKATFLPHFNEQAEFIANEICYFYGRRWRMQRESDRLLEKLSSFIAKSSGVTPGAGAPAAVGVKSDGTAGGVTVAAEPGADITRRLTGFARERWVSSLREYRSRYKGIGDRDISVQMDCLERVLALCHERGIKVVLVNLPLTRANRELMPENFYERFSGQVAAAASRYKQDVSYFDLSLDKRFTDYDFWDTVHMNQLGGVKMMQIVAPALKADLAVK
ncbi:MAG: hypothetical protein KGS72_02290 [Cyanobacteria bacterium REEB67]|nr:hypothetical protein [Cyanobacteria bacterium REEB67]